MRDVLDWRGTIHGAIAFLISRLRAASSLRTLGRLALAAPLAAALGPGNPAIASDSQPSFGTATVADQHFIAGTAASLQLPAAAGGDAPVLYALTGPGEGFELG